MLVDKDIDVSALGLLITPERLNAVDFCWSTTSEKVTLMTTESTSSKLNVWVIYNIYNFIPFFTSYNQFMYNVKNMAQPPD